MKLQELYRQIPKIDRLLETPEIKVLIKKYGYSATFAAVRSAEEELREKIGKLQEELRLSEAAAVQEPESGLHEEPELPSEEEMKAEQLSGEIAALTLKIAAILKAEDSRRMHPVINATGIILHTNLGRAPLSREIMEQISPLMTGYTNLEFDLETGRRGCRYDHFSDMVCALTKAEAAIAVNNNAAAVLLMLSALTNGREAIVSRGELIEIGGKFRIPEVMEQSGTRLVETGTTNRTYAEDYERAVTEHTAAFLKVHTSNYKIMGFTHEASVEELKELGRKHGIPVLVDLGSGSFLDFRKYGLPGEDTVQDILEKGADLVAFSGDKLLGGPQAGIIAGKKELIEKISRHPLTRALRIDKFTAAALEATLRIYQDERDLFRKIPALEMMSRSKETLRMAAQRLKNLVQAEEELPESPFTLSEPEFLHDLDMDHDMDMDVLDFAERMERLAEELHSEPKASEEPLEAEFRILETEALAGGGSMPEEKLVSICLSVKPGNQSAAELTRKLRLSDTPVAARIENDCVLFDMRTIFPEEIPVLAGCLRAALIEE